MCLGIPEPLPGQHVVQPLAQRGVGVSLDQVRPGEVEHPLLGIAEVVGVGEHQADDQPRRRRQRHGELVVDAERDEDLAVQVELAEAVERDDVGQPVHPRIARRQVALNERVLVAVPGPALQDLLRRHRVDQVTSGIPSAPISL